MKFHFLAAATLGLSASLGFAFDLPRGVHEMSALDEARAKAAERPEPVAFLISKVSLRET